jgi:prolyl-tRNA synthetase
MRMSQSLISTLRETPRDAEIISHQLMLRAGLISRVSSGIYSILPLGYRVIKKFEAIVREELDNICGQEVLLPMVSPADLWKKTGRWDKYGKELLRLKDRHGNEFCLGPTHEEVMTDLVKQTVKSYKKLPLLLYQIQSKFRDEIRPRFGLMRGREFGMKDAYSFHDSDESLETMYTDVRKAYQRIFDRCGLSFREVEADNGAIGGSGSSEFMVTSETGEDFIIECDSCSYAANIETADVICVDDSISKNASETLKIEEVSTPGLTTIQDQVDSMGINIENCLKTLVVDIDSIPTLILLRGDHQLNEVKLKKQLKAESVELSSDETVKDITGADLGFAGPVGLNKPLRVIADNAVKTMRSIYAGANKTDIHLKNVTLGRDFTVEAFFDLRFAEKGDSCARCKKGTMSFTRGIEVGHVFKLGTTYSEFLDAQYLNKQGRRSPFLMGCYGIGIGRTVAAAIEQHHDEFGIKWPLSLAPYHVNIILTSKKDDELVQEAESLYKELKAQSFEVIFDDRDESPGVKFKDAALLGFPFSVVIGRQFKNERLYEFQERATGTKTMVSKQNLLQLLKEHIG